jgi:hypothetical protein
VSRPPITTGKEMFFQIEAMVVKNLKYQDFIDGQHDQNEVKYHLTETGGVETPQFLLLISLQA